MTPSLRIRRVCIRLHLMVDLLEKVGGAPASPPGVEDCIVQIEATVMLLESQLTGQRRLSTPVLPTRPSNARRAVLLKIPSSTADNAPDTPRQEASRCADDSP
jgi:hypothetical protein